MRMHSSRITCKAPSRKNSQDEDSSSSSSGAPDLLIHYHANITKRIDVNRVDRGYGYCLGGECPPDVVDYEAGTLVLDIIDTHSNALIWRGWAQNSVHDMLDDPDRMAETIDEAVRLMLLRLPAKQ